MDQHALEAWTAEEILTYGIFLIGISQFVPTVAN